MPCSDPIMTDRDRRCAVAADILRRFSIRGNASAPGWVMKRDYVYPMGERLDEVTAILCSFCELVGEDFIYNGKDRDCRDLANWWDDHKALDRSRR